MGYLSEAQRQKDIGTLARTIMGEAANQSQEGMDAVAHVVANRAAANFGGYGYDVSKQSLAPKQFSAWNSKAMAGNDLVNKEPSAAAVAAATGAIDGTTADPTNGATHYNVASGKGVSKQGKARQAQGENTTTIGDHTFYTTDVTNAQKQQIATRERGLAMQADPAANPAQAAIDNNNRPAPQPDSAASRMWSGVASVLGTTAEAAKSLVAQTGVPSLVNAVTQQAAQVAQTSAQAQNPVAPAPTPATSLAHPQSLGAPVGPVQQGPDLASPIGRINAAAQAAGIQPSRPISATPDTARPSPDVGVGGLGLSPTDLSKADVAGNLVSATGNIAPAVGASPMQAMQENTLNQQVADASVGHAPGTVGVGKPGELGTPMAAPATPAPYSTPMATPPTPKQIAAPVVAPKPTVQQQPMVQAPRPQLPSVQQQQQPAAAAIASTPVNGLTSLAKAPANKPQTESQVAQSIASQPGLMGALGLSSQPQQQSVNGGLAGGGSSSGGGLLSSFGGFMGGLLGMQQGSIGGGIQSVNGSKTKSTLGGGDPHTAL